jgi:flagellar protein FlaG
MKNENGALSPVQNVASFPSPPARQPAPPSAPKTPPAHEEANLRLVIEEDEATGEFIYKTLDRSTGEVVLQLPRKEVLKSLATGAYSAGDVIKARA